MPSSTALLSLDVDAGSSPCISLLGDPSFPGNKNLKAPVPTSQPPHLPQVVMDVYFPAPKLEKAEYSVDSCLVILDHSNVERPEGTRGQLLRLGIGY